MLKRPEGYQTRSSRPPKAKRLEAKDRAMSRRAAKSTDRPTSVTPLQPVQPTNRPTTNPTQSASRTGAIGGIASNLLGKGMFSKGGMAKKKGYAKGGAMKANAGASMKPNRKAKK